MKKWVWIDPSVISAVHDEQVAEHGGLAGLRDAALLESALARPLNLAAYDTPDHAELAACYGVALAKNHPFLDGNKRTAFVAVELFLVLNGWQLNASDTDAVLMISGGRRRKGAAARLLLHVRFTRDQLFTFSEC